MSPKKSEFMESTLRTLAETVVGISILEEDWPAVAAIVRSLATETANMRAYDVKETEPAVIYTVSQT